MGNPKGRPRPHGWRIGNHGYRQLWNPTSPLAIHGVILEHRLVASRVLGKPLPRRAQVHHVNGIKTDNRPSNLVICENRAYHMLLHQRLLAREAGVPFHWRQCVRCSRYDAPERLIYHGPRSVVHRSCQQAYQRLRYAKKAGKL